MSQNPEEGRISDEDYAARLRDARKRTTEMKREYRQQRLEKAAQEKAMRWTERHRPAQEAAMEDLERVSSSRRPLNRAQRRRFAKRMNVFKTPAGWKNFNAGYAKRYGIRQPITKDSKPKEYASNIKQALAAANVTPAKEEK